MAERSAILDVNLLRDPVICLNGLDGVDALYTFYYDETNKIRRLSVAENGFNVVQPQVFVLGGIVHAGPPRDLHLADLRAALRLQQTVKELKFKHVAHGDFLTILGSRKLSTFLEWLEDQDVNLHYLSLDPLYWATVDIIDSIIADDVEQLLMLAPQLKDDLFGLLREDREATADFFFRFGYPDLKASQRSRFMSELLDLLERRSGSLPDFNHYMLKGILQMGARSEVLPFIEDETPHLLIGEFSSFFVHRICLFKNSRHIFDDEEVVKAAIGHRRFVDAGKPLDPYRFARSHDEHGIQISDVVVGLLGRCF